MRFQQGLPWDTVELHFDNCVIPGRNLLGAEGEGFKIAMRTLDRGRNTLTNQIKSLGIQ